MDMGWINQLRNMGHINPNDTGEAGGISGILGLSTPASNPVVSPVSAPASTSRANPFSGWLDHIRNIRQNPQAFKQSVGGDPLKGLMNIFMPGMFQPPQPQQQPVAPQPIMPQSFNNMRPMRPITPPAGMAPLVHRPMAVPPKPPLGPVGPIGPQNQNAQLNMSLLEALRR